METKENKRVYRRRGRATVDLALELEIRKRIQREVDAMMRDIRQQVETAIKDHPAADSKTAQDGLPTWFLVQLFKSIRAKWYPRFNQLADEIQKIMTSKANSRTRKQIEMKLREYGFSLNYHPTEAQKRTLREIVEQNVKETKQLAMFVASHAQAVIVAAYERGRDLKYMTDKLAEMGGIARKKAALIARDQMNRTTQQMAVANAKALGVTRGRWIHVPGYYSSRRTHIKMDGKEFDLSVGMYDPDVGRYVKPGELKYCNCQFQVIVPGFEE